MNILVLGRHGQLGQSLEDILPKTYPNSIFWDRQSLDLQQFDDIEHQLTAQRPDVIVNATAYTAVDQAESNREAGLRCKPTRRGESGRLLREK